MKISPKPQASNTVTFNTKEAAHKAVMAQWWTAKDDGELAGQLLGTAAFLKESQGYRYKQAAIYARLYGNMSLFSFIGANMSKIDQQTGLPADRPTFNVIQSCADTLVSKLSQSRPTPVFLTDNSDYKERTLSKKLNNFILGEFYRTQAYRKAETMLRDALVEGTGCLHVYETPDARVGLERVLLTELLIDPNEAVYGEPRRLYRLKLVDRKVLIASVDAKYRKVIEKAEKGTTDNSAESSKTVSDMILVVEGWSLPSGEDTNDGRHTIACSAGVIFDEEYTRDRFPFVFLHYSTRLLGFWAQGLAEQLMGTQMEINSLLYTISKAIKLVGVPRVFVEKGSKVTKASLNNDVGAIVEYSGTKPSYEVANAVPQELYAQLQRLIGYAYQQCGVSSLDAQSTKPAGLNSGEAIRAFDDISTDRFAALAKRYDNIFVDLAYLVMDQAQEIAKREKKYSTVYPNKNGIREIDLPAVDTLKNPYIVQVFNQSSLPRDPAGRLAKVTEMAQAQMITLQEARRLLDFPDLDQIEKLNNAAEERIFQILDDIVEDGKYTMPDPFMDIQLAKDLTNKYINLYSQAKLEEEKQDMLRNFFKQLLALEKAAQPPAAPNMLQPGIPPAAVPQAPPTSPLLPNAPQVG